MSVSLSTFGKTQDTIEQFNNAQAQQAAVPAPTTEPVAPTDPVAIVEPTVTPVEPQNDEVKDEVEFDMGGMAATTEPVSPEPAQPTLTPQFNLDEELKKIDRKELLKKAGLTDFAIEIDEHIKNGGSAADYINAKAIDWNSVTDEDIIKSKLRSQYPTFSKEEVNRLFDKRYGTTLEEDSDDNLLQLKADAHTERQSRIAEQQRFKLPEQVQVQKDEQYEQWKEAQVSSKAKYEESVNFYNNHEATKSLNESKRVTINLGEGVKPYNFTLTKPELITKALTDDGSIMSQLLSTKTGEPDVQKQQLLTLFAFNPQQFIQSIFNYGMQQGVHKKLVGDGQNAQRPQSVVLPMNPDQKPSYGVGRFGDKTRN